jgi:hypothetical protein
MFQVFGLCTPSRSLRSQGYHFHRADLTLYLAIIAYFPIVVGMCSNLFKKEELQNAFSDFE